jgi:hypothetical protein
MKRLIIEFTIFLLLTVSWSYADAGQGVLRWIPPTTNEDGTPLTDLSGYKVYCGKVSGTYTLIKDVGNIVAYPVTGLSDGTWYCAVTAYNSSKTESQYSNEVSKVIKNVPTKATGCTWEDK